MSIKVMDLVWDSDVQAGRFVLLALADNANDAGLCRPGVAYLSGKTGASRSTVFRALKALEDDQVIQRCARVRPNGSRTSSAFKINLSLLRSRRRPIHQDEQDELAALFEEEPAVPSPCQIDTGGLSTESSTAPGECQNDTGGVSVCDGGSVTVRPPEPSFEPKEPPHTPPQDGGAEDLPATEPCPHGKRPPPDGQGCRPCGTSKRAQEWAERDAEAGAVAAELQARERCPGRMCNPRTGERWDPVTHIPVTPYVRCDHKTPHDAVLAKIRADEDASEARAAERPKPTPHSSPQARAEALAAIRKLRRPSPGEEVPRDDLVGVAS